MLTLIIFISSMSTAQWIFSEEELRDIEKYRIEKYRSMQIERVNEHYITRVQLSKFIYFMRSRKKQLDYPLKFEKVIYYAVALYRRYYLLNIYLQEEPIRNLICAIYVSLKLNEYDEGFIAKMAIKWKEKPVFSPTKRLPHFGDEGYTQSQLNFLSGIKFQTSLNKLIQPIESIYEQIIQVFKARLPQDHQHKDKKIDFYDLIPQIFTQLDRVYYHPTIMFLYDGAKLALTIIVIVLRKKHMSLGVMGDHLRLIAENNIDQIERIITQLDIEVEESSQLYDKRWPKFKKPDPKKSQSPRFQPRPDTFSTIPTDTL